MAGRRPLPASVLARGAALLAFCAAAPLAAQAQPRFGVNLSGAEARGGDAVRPSLTDLKNNIDRYGFDLVRYPFKQDRMTPERIRELRTLTDYARSKGVPFILDNHSFAWPPVEEQIAWWTAFARRFPDDGSILLDLNNEPRGFDDPVLTNDWMQWARDSKRIIAGLRANGIRHPILLEWPGWSATFRFDKEEPARKACESAGCALDRTPGELDPLGRTYMNGHRYFDRGSSGTSASCKGRGGRVRDESGFGRFARQLRERGLKGYVTEVAFGSYRGVPDSCQAVGADAIADMHANADVLLGITWWGGGRIWPENYPFKIDCLKAERFTCPLSPYLKMISPARPAQPRPALSRGRPGR